VTWWIRAYLVFAAVQGFSIGLTGLLSPADIEIPLRITPLNARFVGACTWVGVSACSGARFRNAEHKHGCL
jgi:hypothetical protein